MRLSEWAKREGVSYITAWRWWNEGKLPVPAHKVGKLILVDVPEPGQGRTVVYARVSSAGQKPDLDGQIARVVAWCGNQSLPVDGTVTEIGSALDGRREKFLRLLGDQAVTTIVVERRDRFAWFGAEYIEAALAASGRRLLVANPAGADDDLVRDVTGILTSLCSRLYGRRGAATGPPGRWPRWRPAMPEYQAPAGMTVRGWTVTLEPSPGQADAALGLAGGETARWCATAGRLAGGATGRAGAAG